MAEDLEWLKQKEEEMGDDELINAVCGKFD